MKNNDKILKVFARQVFDSRGNPTIEVEVTTKKNHIGRAIVPSGASTGSREALELRDNLDSYMGKGVTKAVQNVNEIIAPKLIKQRITDQAYIDKMLIDLDGTDSKKNLGANAILGVSLAVSKAAAKSLGVQLWKYYQLISDTKEVKLPIPMLNVLNGGEHADNNVDFQEYMIFPIGAKTMVEALRMSSEVFHNLSIVLKKAKHNTSVGDEGGFAPNLKSNEEALKLIIKAIKNAGYETETQFKICLDVAASEFYDKEKKIYHLKGENRKLTSKELIHYYIDLVKKYPIVSIEDGLDESDWEGFSYMTKKMSKNTQIVGDDLFVTNLSIFKDAVKNNVANSILIKLNQIGTLTETIEVMKYAKDNNYTNIVSHRSGESEDTTIADLAVGLNAGEIKTGSMSRTDRVAKYNRLLRIEEQLQEDSFSNWEDIRKIFMR